jgi:hypothetical protein
MEPRVNGDTANLIHSVLRENTFYEGNIPPISFPVDNVGHCCFSREHPYRFKNFVRGVWDPFVVPQVDTVAITHPPQ